MSAEASSSAESSKQVPIGNGGSADKYTWTQTLSDVTVNIPLPKGTRAKQCDVELKKTKIKCGLKGQSPICDGDLHAEIDLEDSTWSIEDQSFLVLYLVKRNKMQWWSRVLVGDAEIDTAKVDPENSKLSDLDPETRATVEKMMFDQRQKQMGLPSSDELKQLDMLKQLQHQHPELDFSNVKVTGPGAGAGFGSGM